MLRTLTRRRRPARPADACSSVSHRLCGWSSSCVLVAFVVPAAGDQKKSLL